MRKIVDIFAEFPQRHPLVVMPPLILMAYSMGIPNEKRPDLLFDTEVDHLPARFMPLVTNTSLGTLAHVVLDPLQSLPSTRILLASGLPFSKLSKLLGALMFEGTDPTSGYNERLGGRGSHGRQMDFAKIDGRSLGTLSRVGFLRRHATQSHDSRPR